MKFNLEVFEGPLDLLLYLIKKNEIDIHDIPVAQITAQYLAYVEMMKLLNLDMAGEFLVMAATLIHIKSKVLIPRERLTDEDIDVDPRRELVDQLLEYQKYKEIAERLGEKEKERHNIFTRPEAEWKAITEGELHLRELSINELLDAFSNVLDVVKGREPELLEPDEITLEEKIREILDRLRDGQSFTLASLCKDKRTRIEIVLTFLALLELARLRELILKQKERFGEIWISRN
ncbi:MAG: segregation/condensation protein A [Candidatus Omnitrophica bacterium]|nr:segregation/condensation protein A [Candidatus Omnitrophota bacterium]